MQNGGHSASKEKKPISSRSATLLYRIREFNKVAGEIRPRK
jgi:hypothetical protein